ncbi:MAG: EpsG family protein [Phocaeicola sp.]
MILSLVKGIQLFSLRYDRLLRGKKDHTQTLLIAIFLILFMGLRPIHYVFVDTINYARSYYALQSGAMSYDPNAGEAIFNGLMNMCSQIMDVTYFFLIIEMGYIGFMFWACKRLTRNNLFLSFLFCIGAFSFFSYGVNGIRNGLATSIVLLALSYCNGTQKERLYGIIWAFVALGVHKTSALPLAAAMVSMYYSKTKVYLYLWASSIFISLVAGGFVESIFLGLGFDDRLDRYLTSDEYNDQFSNTGFRFDFLLYSMMPILLGYYVVVKRKIYDKHYLLLLNTYIISNAFWVMLIRASFSNRFAYLSWFLYPIVLAYPLLKLPIWRDQGKKTGIILIGHTLFTYIMWILKG